MNVNTSFENAVVEQDKTGNYKDSEMLRAGIKAAQAGNRSEARNLLLNVTETDAANEEAWLWLASMTDEVEEKISHLQKVLRINPENDTAHASLQAAKFLKWEDMMRKANAAAVSGRHEEANAVLDEILQHSPDLEDAWVLKSYLTNSFDEKLEYYEKVLEINPTNETAQASVNSLRLMKSAIEAFVAPKVEAVDEEEVVAG